MERRQGQACDWTKDLITQSGMHLFQSPRLNHQLLLGWAGSSVEPQKFGFVRIHVGSSDDHAALIVIIVKPSRFFPSSILKMPSKLVAKISGAGNNLRNIFFVGVRCFRQGDCGLKFGNELAEVCPAEFLAGHAPCYVRSNTYNTSILLDIDV
jgi:hypothetical protein